MNKHLEILKYHDSFGSQIVGSITVAPPWNQERSLELTLSLKALSAACFVSCNCIWDKGHRYVLGHTTGPTGPIQNNSLLRTDCARKTQITPCTMTNCIDTIEKKHFHLNETHASNNVFVSTYPKISSQIMSSGGMANNWMLTVKCRGNWRLLFKKSSYTGLNFKHNHPLLQLLPRPFLNLRNRNRLFFGGLTFRNPRKWDANKTIWHKLKLYINI